MNLGVLQQFATPLEIYDRPANRFVAGFVGSTQINFLPAAKIPAFPAPARDGDGLSLAVRPEYLRIVDPQSPEATIDARVTLVEPLGAKDVIHLSWNDYDVRALGTPGRRPHIGDNVGLVFDGSHVLFFDDATGQAVA
jgi:ABC-type sugar transport system ATPase subunit